MSYNGSGTFQINTSGQPVVAGTVISSTAFNALTADLATGLSTAITKDGQTTTTVRIPFAQGINSSLATDSSSTSTGSIITAGGIGVAKAAYIGTTLNVASTTTLTGVATLTANPVLSAGTANGVTYLNGSKSLTSGSALTFDGTNFSTTGTASATKLIPTGSSVTGNGLYLPAANALGLSTNGTNAVYIDASQNVGIGTASPSQKFQVYDAAGANNIIMATNGAGASTFMQGTATYGTVGTINNFPLTFLSNNTERMRIDSSGNVIVNATAQIAQSKFGVAFVGSTNQAAAFNETSGAGSWTTVLFQRLGTTIGSISNATSSTAFNTSSDYRLKNTITPMTGALAKVQALKPVTYKWNINNEDGEGFIAHELAEICPQAVTGTKDAVDADGNPVYQGIDTSFLVATLTAALQEAHGLIKDLQARVDALEAK